MPYTILDTTDNTSPQYGLETAMDGMACILSILIRYVDSDGNSGPFPVNPNGSTDDIASLTDSTGRVMGMMPHPERFVRWTQHPRWTRLKQKEGITDGMTIFNNAVNYVRANLH